MVQRVKGKLQMAQHLNPTRMQSKNPMLISMLGYLNAHHGFVGMFFLKLYYLSYACMFVFSHDVWPFWILSD